MYIRVTKTLKPTDMTVKNLKSKLTKMVVPFTELNNSTISFLVNGKHYEAHVTISDSICSYSYDYSDRVFETLNQVLKHSLG